MVIDAFLSLTVSGALSSPGVRASFPAARTVGGTSGALVGVVCGCGRVGGCWTPLAWGGRDCAAAFRGGGGTARVSRLAAEGAAGTAEKPGRAPICTDDVGTMCARVTLR